VVVHRQLRHTVEISAHDAGRGDNLMPTFSRGLEQSLHRALALANERHHEYTTLEHLLLALIDDQDAAAVMRGCNVDVEKLRHNLASYVESELGDLVTDGSEDSKPTAGFQRVIQRAVIHVQSSGREEVTAANVLVAIFAERESHAVYFLEEHEMTRYDAVNFISYGIGKRAGLTERPTPVEEPEERLFRGFRVVDAEPLLQFFADDHVPEDLREHIRPFADLARRLVKTLPSNPERTMALRKLLEAKDCAVRAKLFK
jgi:ATP-dependent Clp protease ATP-binding subunit ClpA